MVLLWFRLRGLFAGILPGELSAAFLVRFGRRADGKSDGGKLPPA